MSHVPCVACHASRVTCDMLHGICHVSRVVCYLESRVSLRRISVPFPFTFSSHADLHIILWCSDFGFSVFRYKKYSIGTLAFLDHRLYKHIHLPFFPTAFINLFCMVYIICHHLHRNATVFQPKKEKSR